MQLKHIENSKSIKSPIEECGRVAYGAMKRWFLLSLIFQIPLAICSILLDAGINIFIDGVFQYYIYPVIAEAILLLLVKLCHTFLENRVGFKVYALLLLCIITTYAEVIVLAYPQAKFMPVLLVLPLAMLSVFRNSKIALFQVVLSSLFYLMDDLIFTEVISDGGILFKILSLISFMAVLLSFFLMEEQVRRATTMLDIQSSKDSLTGLYNHEAFYLRLEEEMEEYLTTEKTFSILIADIDNFKKVNDTYGHVYGDKVLKTVSDILKKRKGSKDFVARYGGEEFAMIMPQCEKEDAIGKADKIRKDMENMLFESDGEQQQITISIGVAEYHKQFSNSSAFVDLADNALYEAKSSGKNRVCLGK